ncbi:MAG: aminotransferase class V-fold PLP-dependent enzyme, partial [Bacteroidales bacterium]|nr:aminotransferase class V-fold PLP-dependent enzyme [Bacteroidales bacterium]
AAGEYTGLMMIRAYHKNNNESQRKTVLIPSSAHGTNPASAVMAGMNVVVIKCDEKGNIDVEDLKAKAEEHKETLAAFMITYPSTHGVFESKVVEMCKIIHDNGGQVYMDGANMNAQTGIINPATIGADVCHLNLHKTFAIPHGGGGPGVGPVAVAKHLSDFLPGHIAIKTGGKKAINAIAASPYGSASILPITHGYLKMLGKEGLLTSAQIAILNANYIAASLKKYFNIVYSGETGYVAHEMILECRNFKHEANISEVDIAKRLMDYGFHAPTLSFPVHGTLMVEPTESESKEAMDSFIQSMISIYNEIQDVKNGKADKDDNVLKNAPHSEQTLIADEWEHSYSREQAAYPLPFIRENKFQIPVGRIDDAYGDRHLMCTCDPVESYE